MRTTPYKTMSLEKMLALDYSKLSDGALDAIRQEVGFRTHIYGMRDYTDSRTWQAFRRINELRRAEERRRGKA